MSTVTTIAVDDFFILLDNEGKWSLFDLPYNKLDEEAYVKHFSGLHKIQNQVKISDGISVIVFITESCNLRCDYCKVIDMVSSPIKKKTKSEEIIESLLQCLDITQEYVTVIFYGGEPLLQYREIDLICSELTSRSRRFRYSVTTNGTLYNKEIEEVLKRHKITIGVSFDGSEQLQNQHRNFINGKNSFGIVSDNYLKMKSADLECGPIAVITNPEKMSEIFEYFTSRYNDSYIYLKPLNIKGNENLDVLQNYFNELLYQQLSLLKKNIQNYAGGYVKRVETYTQIKLKNILLSDRDEIKTCHNSKNSNCSIDIKIKSVEPDGKLIPCPTLKSRSNWNDKTIDILRTKGNYCKGCNYSQVCTSFCLGEMGDEYIHGFIEENDTRPLDIICSYNKQFINAVFRMIRDDWQLVKKYVFE